MDDFTSVQCPYCFETLEVYVDPGTTGTMVQDCEVCCRPWQLSVGRDDEGHLQVGVSRLD